MTRLLVFVLFALLCAQISLGQEGEKKASFDHAIDVSLGANRFQNMASLSYMQNWRIGSKKRLQLTYGLRFSTFKTSQSSNLYFLSAPPEFYMVPEKTDTIIAEGGQNNIVLFIGATYVIKEKLELGFNIDGIGYTFGPSRSALFIGNDSKVAKLVDVSPNQISALLVGANDIGMIKAEFFAGYWITPKWMVRAGMINAFLEYKTLTEVQVGNSRFRADPILPMIGVRYKL